LPVLVGVAAQLKGVPPSAIGLETPFLFLRETRNAFLSSDSHVRPETSRQTLLPCLHSSLLGLTLKNGPASSRMALVALEKASDLAGLAAARLQI
jgi:hypothetical protein